MLDFLIVGHGLAAVAVSEHLRQEQKTFKILSDNNQHSSSKVAAGLYNPITGRKMKETWLANDLFPYLESFYGKLEEQLGSQFLYQKPIYRPFKTIEDQNEWISKQEGKTESKFIQKVFTSPQYNTFVEDPFGGILLNTSGFVDIKEMLQAHQTFLKKNDEFDEEIVDYQQIHLETDKVSYQAITAKNIIFCDGPLTSNPFFDWLPTAPVKGEILHVKLNKPIPNNVIFNKGIFIVKNPKQDYYRVGATYAWDNLNHLPTKIARDQLIQKMDQMLKVPYEIIDQVAGVRPATKDRRPFIGNHPKNKNVFIFNGLGTKGVSLAPHFAKEFCSYLTNPKKLNNEVNISRYYPLYS